MAFFKTGNSLVKNATSNMFGPIITDRVVKISLNRNSALIKRESGNGAKVDLYATLEPCLMCFGTAVHHRLSRIIYACPDPNAGSTHIDPRSMKEVYLNMWPKIFSGLMKEKSCEMMIDFFRNGEPEEWKIRNAKLFENMKKEWE